ncbi:MAG: hypothetical protein K2P94_16825 [Rhodospirillaceae bacterium]|nr:hypothetical protein [Rhodospirillaceae bacterium]
MGEVIRFPLQHARERGLMCPPLKIHFPALYRTVQTVTQADLDALKAPGPPLNGFVDYAINPNLSYFGHVERQRTTHVIDPRFDSLVLRHHAQSELAIAYLTALSDVATEEIDNPVIGTDSGTFTLVRRPTRKTWPGPLVIYKAEFKTAEDERDWTLIIGPDGQEICELDL